MVKSNNNNSSLIIAIVLFIGILIIFSSVMIKNVVKTFLNFNKTDSTLNILSSYENADLEDDIKKFASKNNIKVAFTYMGDLEIVDELNDNSKKYDAVWISNSMWLYMLDNPYLASDSKSISISPIVFGVKKSKFTELKLDSNITNNDILNLILEKKLKYVMSSVTKTNTGATAYIGFLNSLAGNPTILTEDYLEDPVLVKKLTDFFSGVERVSGDENFLKEMFINNDKYEAVIADESSLININKALTDKGKEELYLLYPTDGVAVNDSTFGFISNEPAKEEMFLKIQNYLLSDEGQKMLLNVGRRTWYGGVSASAPENIFRKEWGIDTTKYLSVTKFPSKNVISKAISLYIEIIRKPTHVVFCLDYSGSMYGNGIEELKNAMTYILGEDAKKDNLQFSKKDKITIIPFESNVGTPFSATGDNAFELITKIANYKTGGLTNLYGAIEKGLGILKDEEDTYTKTIIAMTDGAVNVGSFYDLSSYYKRLNKDIPVYSITFGNALEDELEDIASLTNAKVFDGKINLLNAFKEVRGYN